MSGAKAIAATLKELGVEHVFGIVGIPVVEQQASLAASIYGYLTHKPGVLLVVGGPGIVNSVAGAYNAASNKWPLLVLAGSSSLATREKGAFQELDQVAMMDRWTKHSYRVVNPAQTVDYLAQAYVLAQIGVPGCTYVDLPEDIILGKTELLSKIKNINSLTFSFTTPEKTKIKKTGVLLKNARFPLLVVGKGAARAWKSLRQFVDTHEIAFLPTPMAKGIIQDKSEYNISSARSYALKHADVVLVVGARLNWILHFGEAPKFNKNVKLIQIDSDPQELARGATLLTQALHGHVETTIRALDDELNAHKFPNLPAELKQVVSQREKVLQQRESVQNPDLMPSHSQALAAVERNVPATATIVAEGARTMDLSRQSLLMSEPKQRLDAGTNGTMGVGLAYAVTARLTAEKHRMVVAVQGDSAFGFSAMEVETLVRERLPCLVVVLNNSGIYNGVQDPLKYFPYTQTPLPPTSLSYGVRYDQVCASLGGGGYFVERCRELDTVLKKGVEDVLGGKVVVVNVLVGSYAKL
ncbi:hypothetical protein OGAPHI_006253 [Ogataea philodendri]|uniref:2-hydroxyacyl-CoA lyase n=1 Tax=Ogataea philodendri TaxID=1378263 RepID=A0A9P8NYT9_9ASCO|nr:uncharacterized protein OGAPHI_006253 [Ogataea philodendri]KAH3662072.1 hypothetical protein OGAPHI_006253 [Ogataea philodendri]